MSITTDLNFIELKDLELENELMINDEIENYYYEIDGKQEDQPMQGRKEDLSNLEKDQKIIQKKSDIEDKKQEQEDIITSIEKQHQNSKCLDRLIEDEFLYFKDIIELGFLNTKFLLKTGRVALKWGVYDSNDSIFWATVTNFTYISRMHSAKYIQLGINYDNQSEHSRDLDRTFLLEDYETIQNNKLQLDRILRTLSKNGLYFQGLNYIASAFLTLHPEQNSYWYTKFILFKAGNFQNDINLLTSLLQKLSNMVKYHLPELYFHLQSQDLTVQYFGAQWLIAMFSYDTSIQLMLKLWKLIVLSDQNILICFSLCVLRRLQHILLKLSEQALNIVLKTKLKQNFYYFKLLNYICNSFLIQDLGLIKASFNRMFR